jgi:uncharacterized protein YecT (DUF1311 family)
MAILIYTAVLLVCAASAALAVGALPEGPVGMETPEARRYRLEEPLRACVQDPDANTNRMIDCISKAVDEAMKRIDLLIDRIGRAQNPRPFVLLQQAQRSWRRFSTQHCQLYNLTWTDGDGARVDLAHCGLRMTLDREGELEVMAEQFESR